MLDPITALGVAGNLIQFIDFGLKATSKARQIHESAAGTLQENIDIEAIAEDLAAVTMQLELSSAIPTGNGNLDDICIRCKKTAADLLSALKALKVEGRRSKVKSARQALKAILGKKGVEEMKVRLEGFRGEMQFHVLVDLKRDFDIESIKQSERFNNLDTRAKTLLDTLINHHGSVVEKIQLESAKSDERHLQTTVTIISKQEETQTEVTKIIEGLDASSRAEHEATRRELEQMKQTMAKIEQDMARRDEELKGLLIALSQAHTERERKKLQEKSNAVTAALFALVTIYESLQRIVVGLQAHARTILTSTNIQRWVMRSLSIPENFASSRMLDAIINTPTDFITPRDLKKFTYITKFDRNFGMFYGRIERVDRVNFAIKETIEYKTIGLNSGINPELMEVLREEVGILLDVLDPANGSSAEYLGEFNSEDPALLGRRLCTLDLLKSLVIISTLLVQCLGYAGAAKVISDVFFPTPATAYMTRPINLPPSMRAPEDIGSRYKDLPSSLDAGSEMSPRTQRLDGPAIIHRQRLRKVVGWATVGKITGLQETVAQLLSSRLRKWDADKRWMAAMTTDSAFEFLHWVLDAPDEEFFTLEIETEADRARGAVLYAMVEYLIEAGFCLMTPIIAVARTGTRHGMFVRVGRMQKSGPSTQSSDEVFMGAVAREEFARSLEANQSAQLIGMSVEAIRNDILRELMHGDSVRVIQK